ncbi:MAG TPA: hypothetical protein PKL70_07825 [Saprospiraceae bacterium]|nr:hypothetical protein [Saprospiraceae bacterium]
MSKSSDCRQSPPCYVMAAEIYQNSLLNDMVDFSNFDAEILDETGKVLVDYDKRTTPVSPSPGAEATDTLYYLSPKPESESRVKAYRGTNVIIRIFSGPGSSPLEIRLKVRRN